MSACACVCAWKNKIKIGKGRKDGHNNSSLNNISVLEKLNLLVIRQHDLSNDYYLIVFVLPSIFHFRNKFSIFFPSLHVFLFLPFPIFILFFHAHTHAHTHAHAHALALALINKKFPNLLYQSTIPHFLTLGNHNFMCIGEDLPTMFSLLLNPAATETGKKIILDVLIKYIRKYSDQNKFDHGNNT